MPSHAFGRDISGPGMSDFGFTGLQGLDGFSVPALNSLNFGSPFGTQNSAFGGIATPSHPLDSLNFGSSQSTGLSLLGNAFGNVPEMGNIGNLGMGVGGGIFGGMNMW